MGVNQNSAQGTSSTLSKLSRFIFTNLKHFFGTLILLSLIVLSVAIYFGADIDYGDNMYAYKLGDEGPHIFYEGEQLVARHIRGERDKGFYVEEKSFPANAVFTSTVQFPLDASKFNVTVNPVIEIPPNIYDDGQPILAISDIESAYKTLRDFLLAHKVVDQQLNWTFGKGHLVLLGDFVDRDASATQTLWLIYRLEQLARAQGGTVHYILGNHEIKSLQGNYQSAAKKYLNVAAILGKQQYQLFDDQAFLGRWLASKNTAELINGHLFVHGGIHPKLTSMKLTLQALNQIVRDQYRKPYFPTPAPTANDILLSTRYGPSWNRGYFEDDLTQAEVNAGLEKFKAKAVVVGHTPQWKIKTLFDRKVIAINVKHPRDYRGSIPPRSSEALLIESENYFRLLADGSKEVL